MLENLLRWYVEIGADEAIGEVATNHLLPGAAHSPAAPDNAVAFADAELARRPAQQSAPKPMLDTRLSIRPGTGAIPAAVAEARRLAAGAESLAELEEAVRRFDGCALKATATRTVFADGNPAAPLMILGDAPGSDEDRSGVPFAGSSGRLLDRMLASIGLDRSGVYLSNVLFWRPPGNRPPTGFEIDICKPFVERHIALAQPKLLIFAGAVACGAMLPINQGIARLRGRSFEIQIEGAETPIQAIAMYHPSFLLNSPDQKRQTWRDLLSVKSRLKEVAK